MSKFINSGIKVEKSKFSVLKIEDDENESGDIGESPVAKSNQKSKTDSAAKPKQTANQKKMSTKTKASNKHQESNKAKQFIQTDWETWKKKDEEVCF
jgi:hypothetical protein